MLTPAKNRLVLTLPTSSSLRSPHELETLADAATRAALMRHRAFTLIELLVVIAIMAILMMAMFPAVANMRESARRSQCANNFMRLGLAFQEYISAQQRYPAGVVDDQGPILSEPQGRHQSWTIALLPYLEERTLYEHIDLDLSVYDPAQEEARSIYPRVYICPSSNPTSSGYAGVHHDIEAPLDGDQHGILFLNSEVSREDIPDGRGYTLLLGERLDFADDLGWMSGTRATLRNTGHAIRTAPSHSGDATSSNQFVGGFGSPHPAICGFLFADGRVESLSEQIEPQVLQQLGHRCDGSLVDISALQ